MPSPGKVHVPVTAADGEEAGYKPSKANEFPLPACTVANFCCCEFSTMHIAEMRERLAKEIANLPRKRVLEGRIILKISCESFSCRNACTHVLDVGDKSLTASMQHWNENELGQWLEWTENE